MSIVDIKSISKQQHDMLACAYAWFILHDSNNERSSVNIQKLMVASKNDVHPLLPVLF